MGHDIIWDSRVNARLSSPPSVVFAVREIMDVFQTYGNRYRKYSALLQKDPTLYGAIATMASLVSHSFKGLTVWTGAEVDDKERQLIQRANAILEESDIRSKIYQIAFSLIRDGDVVMLRDSLKILPMSNVTAVEKRSQIGQIVDDVIQEANFYVINEGTEKQQVLTKDQVIHISLNPTDFVEDNYGRKTFGIWSMSPIETVAGTVLWKLSLMKNDMLWRYRLIPREHHKLSSEAFRPELYAGKNIDEKIANAKAAAQRAISEYVTEIEKKEADQGYVTLDNVEIEIVEPKGSYSDPNELVNQLNQNISIAIGIPVQLLGSGQTKGSYAAALAMISFVMTRVSSIIAQISPAIKEYIISQLPAEIRSLAPKLRLVWNVVLERDRGDLARQIAVLKETGILTIDELRALWGAPIVDPEQLPITTAHRYTETTKEISADFNRRKDRVRYDVTPHTKKRTQITLGGGEDGSKPNQGSQDV